VKTAVPIERRTLGTFAVCFFAYAFSQLDLALFAYALPAIRAEFGASLQQMALVISIAYVIGGIVQVWMGHLTDSWGRKRILMLTTVASSIFVALHAAAVGILSLALARAGAIGTGGAIYPSTGAIVTEEAPARYRGMFAGMLQVAYPFGWFMASLLAAPILIAFGWRAMFLVALLSIPYVLVIHFAMRETRRFDALKSTRTERPTLRASLRTMLSPALRRRTITLFVAQFLFVIAYGGSSFLLPTYFTEHRGLPINMSAYLVGVGNAVSIFGYIAAAYIGEFVLTRRTTVVIFTMLGAAGFAFMLWVPEGFYPTMAAFALMSIFFYGTAAVKFAYIAELFPTELRATGLAVCGSLAVNLGIAIGPLLVSTAVAHIGWQLALSWAVVVPLMLAGSLYLFLKPIPSGLEVEDVQDRIRSQDRS
jgi:MFS family permease